MSNDIDIHDLDKAKVLAALYNATAPGGMGFLQAGNGPSVMTVEQAQELLGYGTSPDPGSRGKGEMYFDYLFGRCLKVDLSGDTLDPWGFDRDNGQGAAQKVIDELRATDAVDSSDLRDRRQSKLIENRDKTVAFVGETDNVTMSESGIPFLSLGGADVATEVMKHMDVETERLLNEA